jgi:hypothetical protein
MGEEVQVQIEVAFRTRGQVRLLVLPLKARLFQVNILGANQGHCRRCLVRTDRFSFDAPVNGRTLDRVVLCCSAVPWGRSMVPLSASSCPPLSPHLWGASPQIRKSRCSLSLSLPQLRTAPHSSSQLFQAPCWPVQTPHSACSTPVQTLNSPRFALGGLPCLNPLPRTRTDYSTWGTMGCTPASPGQSQAEAYHGTINPSITTHQNGTGFL